MFEPSASITALQKRAQLLRQLRAFFYERGVLEVDVPVLGDATITDVHLEPLMVHSTRRHWFLQTSPEYYMKRMLAAGSGNIFYLGRAFREDESGRRHRPEFTMLEWYREGFDDAALMQEVGALFSAVAPDAPLKMVPYADVFEASLGVCPHRATAADLRALAQMHVDFSGELDKSEWLDLLFSHIIEPTFAGVHIVYDYPQEQCALARVQPRADGTMVAKRFEVYWRGTELANGYWELASAAEQRQRFEADQQLRRQQGRAVPAIDERFMAAIERGLPDCAGVALGVDRLLMCLLGENDIASVVPFADH